MKQKSLWKLYNFTAHKLSIFTLQLIYYNTTADFFLLHLIASFHIEAWYNFILYMLSVNFALECFTAVTSYRCTQFSNFLSYFLSTVQIHNIASLQVLCNLCLPHILLYIHSAGPRLAQVSLHPFTAFTRHSTCSINTVQLWQQIDVEKPFDASCLINRTAQKWKRQGGKRQNTRTQIEMWGHMSDSDYRAGDSKCVIS